MQKTPEYVPVYFRIWTDYFHIKAYNDRIREYTGSYSGVFWAVVNENYGIIYQYFKCLTNVFSLGGLQLAIFIHSYQCFNALYNVTFLFFCAHISV